MARRSTEAVTEADVTDETVAEINSVEPTTETDEQVVSDPQTDTATEGSDEGEGEPDEVIDLSGLWSALDSILNGDISSPSDLDYSSVSTAYAALSRKGKGAATRELSAKANELLEGGDFDKARVTLLAGKAVKAAKAKSDSTRTARTPADPTAALVEKLTAFQLAYAITIESLPEGTDADAIQAKVAAEVGDEARAQIRAFRDWSNADPATRGEQPEVSSAVAMAGKFAFRQTRKPYGTRHNVGEHIAQVFARAEVGTELTDAQIAAEKSDEYGDDECSTSAVSARLNSGKPLGEGLELVMDNDKAVGVRKVA